MKATDIRRGHVILIDGQPSRVMEFHHRTPGNPRAFVQVRARNPVTGNTLRTPPPPPRFLGRPQGRTAPRSCAHPFSL